MTTERGRDDVFGADVRGGDAGDMSNFRFRNLIHRSLALAELRKVGGRWGAFNLNIQLQSHTSSLN